MFGCSTMNQPTSSSPGPSGTMPKARTACSVCCPRPSLAFGNADTALERVREHTQAMLERERELVLSGLSDTYKGQWGKRFEHEERTVIVKSPYDVPMGPERSMWMNKFSTLRKTNRLDNMPHLVYDEQDQSFELVSPLDLEEPEDASANQRSIPSGDSGATAKRPVEAYDLLSLEPSAINQELMPEKKVPDNKEAILHRDLPLGTRLRVYWPDDKQWYDGTVDEHSGAITHVTYDDNDEHWIRLSDEKYKVLPPRDNAVTAAAAVQEEPEPHSPSNKKNPKKGNPKKEKEPKKNPKRGSGGNSGSGNKSTSAATPRKRAVADRERARSTLEDTEDEDCCPCLAATTTSAKKKRKRSANDETDGESTRRMPTRNGDRLDAPSLDQSYCRPKKEPKRLRNGKFVATDPAPEGYEWCDTLGLWRVAGSASEKDAKAASAAPTFTSTSDDAANDDDDDDESYQPTTDDDNHDDLRPAGKKKSGARVGVCLQSLAHALLDEKANHTMRIAYAKLGTMKHLGDPCPPVESDPSVKGKMTTALAAAPAIKSDESVGDASEEDEEGKVAVTMDRRTTASAAPAVKCDESVGEASEDGEGKVFVKMDLDRPPFSCPPVHSDLSVKGGSTARAVKTDDVAASEDDDEDDEVKVVSVKKGSSPAMIRASPIRSSAPTGGGAYVSSAEAMHLIHRIKQALEWQIDFKNNVVGDATLKSLHKLLEPLQSIRMTVQLLHETNINVSLVQLKSDLSSHKSPATKPVLKLTKQILGKWREIYEQHKHMHKKLRPVVQSWRQAVESDHAQGIGVELQQFVELINARGLCRHVVRELGLEELIHESRKVYARHNARPAEEFEDLHVRILNAPEELQV